MRRNRTFCFVLTVFAMSLLLSYSHSWAACDISHKTECYTGTTTKTVISCYNSSVNGLHVQWTIDSASPGDTVIVPPGSCNWDNKLTINKGINLMGSGQGITIIKNTITGANWMIDYDPADYNRNDPFRLSGFTFDTNGNLGLKLGSGKAPPFTLQTKVRIDHNTFMSSGAVTVAGQAIVNYGSLYGVIDNNIFDGLWYPVRHHSGTAIGKWWNYSPQNIFMPGSEYYMYWEDNIFNLALGGKSDNTLTNGQYSMRYVFRYNTITNEGPAYAYFDLHGYQPGGNMDSCFGGELYGNQVTSNYAIGFLKQRAGQTFVFNNNFVTSVTPANTAYTGTTTDPCPTDDKAHQKVVNNSYWWGSRKNFTGVFIKATATADLNCGGLTGMPQLGRDVFSDTSTPGVSCGRSYNMPTVCTVGQGYWATDQSCSDLTGQVGQNPRIPISGTLYKCTAPNTWTAYYTPYPYPHPLRTEVAYYTPPTTTTTEPTTTPTTTTTTTTEPTTTTTTTEPTTTTTEPTTTTTTTTTTTKPVKKKVFNR